MATSDDTAETDTAIDATHPGFTVTCQKCNGTKVIVTNTVGMSYQSGAWGEVSLECQICSSYATIWDPN